MAGRAVGRSWYRVRTELGDRFCRRLSPCLSVRVSVLSVVDAKRPFLCP
jgi:hypothetical protein